MTDLRLEVPMLDLGYQNRAIADEVADGFARVIDGGGFVLGPEVETFEAELAAYLGVARSVGVGNGTDAVELALRASGVGSGDEVIVPANTFFATAEGVLRSGARLRLVDCDDRFLIDPAAVAEALTPRTRAVIAVHLYGRLAPVDRLREIVGDDVVIVEDAAQSQGARTGTRAAGGLGDVAAMSFYPGKNLGAFGDAGAVTTSSGRIADRVARLRNHGGTRRYEHEVVGLNSRLDGLQAVVLSAKLRHLDAWNRERAAIAEEYGRGLADDGRIVTPAPAPEGEHVFHQYVVQVPDRDRIVAELQAEGVGVAVHYPVPLHRLPALAGVDTGSAPLVTADRQAPRLLSLPIYPGLGDRRRDIVIDRLRSAL